MAWKLTQFSQVVVGDSHNPSILNPDFLLVNQVVPSSWRSLVRDPITTPALSVVRFDNGVSITVEMNKIQVVDTLQAGEDLGSKVPDLTTKYVQLLQHVRYTAVGNNFQYMLFVDNPEGLLMGKFLREGNWNCVPAKLDSIGLKFVYRIDPIGQLLLSFDVAEVMDTKGGGRQKVVLCNANFSRDCNPTTPALNSVDHLQRFNEDWKTLREVIHEVFPENEGAKE